MEISLISTLKPSKLVGWVWDPDYIKLRVHNEMEGGRACNSQRSLWCQDSPGCILQLPVLQLPYGFAECVLKLILIDVCKLLVQRLPTSTYSISGLQQRFDSYTPDHVHSAINKPLIEFVNPYCIKASVQQNGEVWT